MTIEAANDLSGTIAPLSQRFSPAVVLLRQRCAERLRGGQVSSFIVGGRDGVPVAPDGVLSSPLYRVATPAAESESEQEPRHGSGAGGR